MPISDDLHHRSLVTKLLGYNCIVEIPNRCNSAPTANHAVHTRYLSLICDSQRECAG